jgi:hypothetical protein
MSKVAQRRRPAKRHSAPRGPSWLSDGNTRFFLGLGLLIVLAGIPFALGKWFEFHSPDPFDGGAYVYSAAHILQGAEIGVEEKPSAQLGTLLVNMLGVKLWGFSDTGPKTMQMLLQIAALTLTFAALYRLYGMLAAAVGVIIASIYLSSPLIAKDGNVKEQYMIAFMLMGVSCYVFYVLRGRWWYAMFAGALLSWGPLFKQTGVSAIGAVGLFVVLQPVFGYWSFRQMGRDVLLLLAGAAVGIGPIYLWVLGWNVDIGLPYAFVWQELGKMLPFGGAAEGPVKADYIAQGRKLVPFSDQWPIVLRFYSLFLVPIGLALGAILARLGVMLRHRSATKKIEPSAQDRLVLLLALWWILDMAFVWISPNSYEQYYLPLNASAAMLGGYLIYLYSGKLMAATDKSRWVVLGLVGLILMIVLSWHVFFGITKSPYSGRAYLDPQTGRPDPRKGYLQRYREIAYRVKEGAKAPWEGVGQYMREHSQPTDKIYVWGWYPGIYVQAQRFSSAARAFAMPRYAPAVVEQTVAELIEQFQQEPPKFIVDARKRHVPTIRPPYELWPIVLQGFMGFEKSQFLPSNELIVDIYDKAWAQALRTEFDEEEALRYEAYKPLRKFVMDHYRIVNMFGPHVLFELKSPPAGKESS